MSTASYAPITQIYRSNVCVFLLFFFFSQNKFKSTKSETNGEIISNDNLKAIMFYQYIYVFVSVSIVSSLPKWTGDSRWEVVCLAIEGCNKMQRKRFTLRKIQFFSWLKRTEVKKKNIIIFKCQTDTQLPTEKLMAIVPLSELQVN